MPSPLRSAAILQVVHAAWQKGVSVQVVAGWQINEQQLCSHFKLIRVPGQVPLTPQQACHI